MIDLYTAATPNGTKVPILLAEVGEPWRLHKLDLGKQEQKEPAYLAINPNGKIPALVDETPGGRIVIFESGAILQYVAEKYGKLLPTETQKRYEVLSWVFWQVGGPGPMFGQAGAFGRETPRNEKAYAKFVEESRRLVGVLDARLAGREYIAGDYSIADIACYPWFDGISKFQPVVVEGAARVAEWMARIAARPAVKKGMALESPT